MTEEEKLKLEIQSLREAIRESWVDLEELPLTPAQRHGLRQHITDCVNDLADLLARLNDLDAPRP